MGNSKPSPFLTSLLGKNRINNHFKNVTLKKSMLSMCVFSKCPGFTVLGKL